MDLLTNAVESIQVGLEDYLQGTRPRLLSAIRNIHAGILLLYKEALLRRSPIGSDEALLKAKIEPKSNSNGEIVFVGVGRKTVEIHQIRERFSSLGISTDWTLLNSITRVRNDVEHYFPNVTQDAMSGVVSSALLLIRTFAETELDEDPRTLLGQETWDAMLQIAAVHAVELSERDAALGNVYWQSDALLNGIGKVRCDECGSDLLRPEDETVSAAEVVLACRACGGEKVAERFIPEAIFEALEVDAYLATKDGADEPLVECPDCSLPAYVVAEGRCAYCGWETPGDCARCGSPIPSSELGSAPLCGYCEHTMSKDD